MSSTCTSSSGFIPWIIKKDAFRKFHNKRVGEFMVSEEVTKQKMIFYMKCYPNGSKHKFEGWCGLSLTLKKTSIPSNITNILVRYYLYESQTSSVARGIARFSNNDIVFSHDSNNNNNNNNNNDNPPQRRRRKNSWIDLTADTPTDGNKKQTGYAKANGTNYLCQLYEFKKYDTVNLVCEFEIIRMYKLGQLIHGEPLRLNKIIKYEWDITNKNLEKFRLCNNPYTRLYSEEFNIYNLVLVPSATTYSSKGNISLRLRLHELPPIIKSINVIVRLSCKQLNKSWTNIVNLSYDQPWVSWPSNTLKKSVVDEKLNNDDDFDCISFQCYIEILDIDLHNLIISENDSKYKDVWNKFVKDETNAFMKENKENILNNKQERKKINPLQRRKNAIIDGNNNQNDDDTKSENKDNNGHDYALYDIIDNGYNEENNGNDDDDDDDDGLWGIYKKEDLIRLEILKSLDLNDSTHRGYLMTKFYNMSENIRVLHKEKHDTMKLIKQLESTIQSMPENMVCTNTIFFSVEQSKVYFFVTVFELEPAIKHGFRYFNAR